MTHRSTRYRQDPADGIPEEIREYLDQHYLQKLPNLDRHNPKLLVVFSGGNAMGKSTISRRLADDLGGLVLENDEIKRNIKAYDPDLDWRGLNVLTWKYSMDLYSRLGSVTPNGLVVRDGVIDWYHDRILPVFTAQGYRVFIIGFDISRDKKESLIIRRGDQPTVSAEKLLGFIDDHELHIGEFRKHYTPDIMLTDENLFDHDRVVEAVKSRLAAMA